MLNNKLYRSVVTISVLVVLGGCNIPTLVKKTPDTAVPPTYDGRPADSVNSAAVNWRAYFSDPYLHALIDTALKNNQELNIVLQEIEVSRNEVRARKGEYLPSVGLRGGAGLDKVGRFTNIGAMEATTEMEPGVEMPEPVPDYMVGAFATWEIDIWKKLRNAKKAAVARYLGSIEGRNFAVTGLVSEVANSYYELLALDKQLQIVNRNIEIQSNALEIVKRQKEAARVTELAVRKFEAEVAHTKSLQYAIRQKVTETENQINFLLGRYPQAIPRDTADFTAIVPSILHAGIPSQLLENRPDVKKAEQELLAAKLDVKVARARFYPSIGISASAGFRAFDPNYLFKSPESLIYSLAADLAAPLINRNEIKATYYSANAKQLQAVYNYERTILNAYIEVYNQLSNINNLEKSYALRAQQVEALSQSVNISNALFNSARADYMEVLLTQRDALEAKFELIDVKKEQMNAAVNIYRALGGGWR